MGGESEILAISSFGFWGPSWPPECLGGALHHTTRRVSFVISLLLLFVEMLFCTRFSVLLYTEYRYVDGDLYNTFKFD